MIFLFINIYKEKEFCPVLLRNFREIIDKQEDNIKNIYIEPYLKNYMTKYNEIISESEYFIKNNNLNFKEFY